MNQHQDGADMMVNHPQAMNPESSKIFTNEMIQNLEHEAWSLGSHCCAPKLRLLCPLCEYPSVTLETLFLALASMTVVLPALSLGPYRSNCQS